MNNIKNITIRNYRGIRYAEVSDMARVNVFLGNNNCGKSSVLESVLMLLGANSPALPLAVNVNRNYSTVDKNDFALFFHTVSYTHPNGSGFCQVVSEKHCKR